MNRVKIQINAQNMALIFEDLIFDMIIFSALFAGSAVNGFSGVEIEKNSSG
jgi:hypothetical protein